MASVALPSPSPQSLMPRTGSAPGASPGRPSHAPIWAARQESTSAVSSSWILRSRTRPTTSPTAAKARPMSATPRARDCAPRASGAASALMTVGSCTPFQSSVRTIGTFGMSKTSR